MAHLDKNGLDRRDRRTQYPLIVHVKADGNYIMRGPRVTDAETLGQMHIPHHETCIEILRSSVLPLLAGV